MNKAMPGTARAAEERAVRKPKALPSGSFLQAFAPASPGNAEAVAEGLKELERLGFRVGAPAEFASEGYFAGSKTGRGDELSSGLANESVDGLVAVRGGYGSNYLLDELKVPTPATAKLILGYSDLTSLQIYFWQKFGWVTIYGPMIAAGIAAGAGAEKGYDRDSLLAALQQREGGWRIELYGESLNSGAAEGRILGGCMTLVETTLGTPWELDTRGSILLLEDRGMKPWQVDRALMHLRQAGKFEGVRGILLGDFPECEAPLAGSPTVEEVCRRILAPLGVPIVFGAPVGHTMRPMLTVPLGVNARLIAKGEGVLEILEPAVIA
jgi:muramoyltetrapeptide carboxypeptidase